MQDGDIAAKPVAGNSANAAAVATASAAAVSHIVTEKFQPNLTPIASNQLLKRRRETFNKFNVPQEIGEARISKIAPLCGAAVANSTNGSGYGFVIVDQQIMLGKGGYLVFFYALYTVDLINAVMAIYSKSAGKSGKHGLVSDVTNIAAVSNIPIQLFEHFIGVQFRAHHAGQTFHMKTFDVLPSLSFLCTLDSTPAVIDNGHSLKISQLDWSLFKSLKDSSSRIVNAIAMLNTRAKKSQGRLDDEED
jgi:hypothetical protein